MVIQVIVNGIAMGAIYALVALSFVLIYNAVGVINFATGDVVVLGGYIGVALTGGVKLPLVWSFAGTVLVMMVLGYLFQLVGYYPLRGKPFLTVAISTLAIGIIMTNGILVGFGPEPRSLRRMIDVDSVEALGIHFVPQHLVIIVVAALVLGLQYLLFNRTGLGRRMTATAQDPEMASMLGIRVDRMVALTFVLAFALAAVGGYLVAPVFWLTPDMGFNLALKGFAAAIIGSFGSVPGAIIGALALGIGEILIAFLVSSAYRDVFVFLAMLLVLYIRPEGLLGARIGQTV